MLWKDHNRSKVKEGLGLNQVQNEEVTVKNEENEDSKEEGNFFCSPLQARIRKLFPLCPVAYALL